MHLPHGNFSRCPSFRSRSLRALVSCFRHRERSSRALLLAPLTKKQDRQRRQSESERVSSTMTGHRCRFHLAEIANTTATIDFCIAVEPFVPNPAARSTDKIIMTDHRRKITNNQDDVVFSPPLRSRLTTLASLSLQSIHSNPAGSKSTSWSAASGAIESIQIGHPSLHSRVQR